MPRTGVPTNGDWRSSSTGTKQHYGRGPMAVCGSPRLFLDPVDTSRYKCVRCLRIVNGRNPFVVDKSEEE